VYQFFDARAAISGIDEADIRMKDFAENTKRRIDSVKSETHQVAANYESLEVKIRKFNAELRNSALDGLSKLLLGVEMPKEEKRRVVVSTLQILEARA
jgi:hypothetical protein